MLAAAALAGAALSQLMRGCPLPALEAEPTAARPGKGSGSDRGGGGPHEPLLTTGS